MASRHSTDLVLRSLPPHTLQQRQHVLRLTQSVYVKIFYRLWPWDIDNIEMVLVERLDISKHFFSVDLEKLRTKSPEHFDTHLLYKLLIFVVSGNILHIPSSADGTLEQCLKTSIDLFTDIHHRGAKSFENLHETCVLLKTSLLQLLTKVEERTGSDLSEAKLEVLTESPLSCAPSTLSNKDIISDIFATLLRSLFIVILENSHVDSHSIVKDCLHLMNHEKYKERFPRDERREIETCTSIRNLSWQTIKVLVLSCLEFEENISLIDKVIVNAVKKIRKIKNMLTYSLHLNDNEFQVHTNQCYQAVEAILQCLNDVHDQGVKFLLVQLATTASLSTEPPTTLPGLSQTSTIPSTSKELLQKHLTSNPSHPTSTTVVYDLTPSLSTSIISGIPGPLAVKSQIPQSASSPISAPSSPPIKSTVSSSPQSQETSVPSHSSPVASVVSSPSSQNSVVLALPSALRPSSLYTQEDMNVLRVFCALRKGGPAVQVFAKVFELLFPQGLNAVISYCTGKMMRYFTKDEREHITNNTPLHELDLTFLYKVIGKVCSTTLGDPEKWNDPSKPFGHLLYRVKGIRNFQSHEAVVYTNHDLVKVADKLKDCLRRIIELLGYETGVDLSEMEREVSDELNKIFTDPPPVESFKEYCDQIKCMREELAQETMSKGRKELQRYYDSERLRIINPITWYHNPDIHDHTMWDAMHLYTELEIKDTMDNSNESMIVTRDILTLMTPQTNILVIEGAAGAGKTSICKFLLQCWKCNVDTKVNGLVEVDLMIFIQCRYVHSESLIDFLTQSLLPGSLYSVQRSDVILSLSDARILFVIDGYDEADYKARNIVQEALVKFPSSSAIITTRPEFRPEIDLMINSCRSSGKRILLTVNGFGDHNRFVYIHKLFHQMGEDPDGFLVYLESVDEYLGSFTRLPLTLALLSLTWVNRTENFTTDMTVTQLYQRIVDLFLNRFIDRQRQRPGETRHQKDIKRKAFKWLDTLGKVAWGGIQEGRTHLNDSEETLMRDKSDELGIDATEGLSCLLQCQITPTSMEDEMMWEFIHKSVQEYLSALNRVTIIGQNKESFIETLNLQDANDYNVIKKYIRLLEFIAGICAERNYLTEEVAKQLLHVLQLQKAWAFDAIYSMSRECGSSPAFKKCLKEMFDGHTLLESLEDHNVVHLHFILQWTSLGLPTSVCIKLNSEDIRKSKDLVDLLSARGCYPQLHVRVSGPQCVQSTVDTLKTFKNPSQVAIIFHIQRNNTFTDLINLWPWEMLPLVIEFPYWVFSLLWLQFSACMAANNIHPSRVEYVGNADGNRAVKYLCTALKADLVLCHPGDSAQITIFSRITPLPPSGNVSKYIPISSVFNQGLVSFIQQNSYRRIYNIMKKIHNKRTIFVFIIPLLFIFFLLVTIVFSCYDDLLSKAAEIFERLYIFRVLDF